MAASHLDTEMRRMGAERKDRCFSDNDVRVATRTDLRAKDQILEEVDTSKYIIWMLYFDTVTGQPL